MVSILGANSVSGGYEIENSLRLNDDDSAYLSFDPSGSGTTGTWTASWWMKLGNLTNNYILSSGAVNQRGHIFISSNTLRCQPFNSTGASKGLTTDAVLRDPSAWYHCVIVANGVSTSNISSNLKIYINGVEQSTSGTGSGSPSGGDRINDAQAKRIGELAPDGGGHFDGYLSEFHFIDGTAKAQTDFGEFDDNGVWIPKEYDGTYGTNGWYLEFKQTGTSQNSSGIGADTSGQDNHWAVTNLAAIDVTEDTPTNNFCTMNPLAIGADATLSEGNCQIAYGSGTRSVSTANMGFASGKWYWEWKISAASTDGCSAMPGIGGVPFGPDLGTYLGNNSDGYAYNGEDGKKYSGGANSAYGDTFTTNDIISVAFDADNGNLYFYKNGTIQNSGTAAYTSLTSPSSGFYYPAMGDASGAKTFTAQANFGNPPFSISSGNNDGKYGNFEYAPPSGYYALCTKRLAEFG